jgi:hypothetical protein
MTPVVILNLISRLRNRTGTIRVADSVAGQDEPLDPQKEIVLACLFGLVILTLVLAIWLVGSDGFFVQLMP